MSALGICLTLLSATSDALDLKFKSAFRNYEEAPAHVKAFYKTQHLHQTLAFAQAKFNEYQYLLNEEDKKQIV